MNTAQLRTAPTLATTILALALLQGCATPRVPLDDGPARPPFVEPKEPAQPPTDTGSTGTGKTDGTVLPPSPPSVRRIVYFDFDSTDIRADSQRDLEALAQHLRHAQTDGVIVLEGHADERGGREYNLALGQKRAEAVRRALALLGVPAARMEAISFGEEKPAVVGQDEAAWRLNRRVELPAR